MKEIKLSNDQREALWNEVKECEELINLHIALLFQMKCQSTFLWLMIGEKC